MNDLMKEIYESIICNREDALQMDKYINNKIEEYIALHREEFPADDMEKIMEAIYMATLIAEEESFQLGVKYALKMLIALLSDS